MQTTPEYGSLLEELYERASIVVDLDGPQLEAWVSGLFPVFDTDISIGDFVTYCADARTGRGAVLIAAIAELSDGLDVATSDLARGSLDPELLPDWSATIGTSELTGAWTVTAPFGRSIVLGFNAASIIEPTMATGSEDATGEDAERVEEADDEITDLRHSILVELGDDGCLEDLQLAGAPMDLLEEAKTSGDRVRVVEIDADDALAAVVAAWPGEGSVVPELGPGSAANQQFVRRRMLVAADQLLAPLQVAELEIDVRRGLDDRGFADANRAALSTMQSAVGFPDEDTTSNAPDALVQSWVSVVTGVAGELAPRERDALLWLEWADWLGAGIGLLRAGSGTPADSSSLVEHVNRCPEVSSTISKADRDYAEWAFDVALDLLEDAGVVTEDHVLTEAGRQSLWVGLAKAWSTSG